MYTPGEGTSSGPRKACGNGFTLVELLVVIAILGILARLLLPVPGKAKDRAIRVTDINNLKQLSTAQHVYASDHADLLPWANRKWGDHPDRAGWLYRWNPQGVGPAQFRAETGVFWRILQQRRLFMCPRDGPQVSRFTERAQQSSSYVLNGAVVGYNRTNWPALKLGAFRPEEIVFWETDERYPEYFKDGASYPREGVSGRHTQGAIHATFGGAVSYIPLARLYLMEAQERRNPLWCYRFSEDGR